LAAAAPLGMPSGKAGQHPGWKPLQGSADDHVPGWAPSPCRLPGPVTRYLQVSVGFSPPRPQRAPPSERQKMCAGNYVKGRVCGASSQTGLLSRPRVSLSIYLSIYLSVSSIGAIFGSLGSWDSLGNLGNLVLGNLILGNRAGCVLGRACVRGKVSAGRIS
jgi:hypothetical protein